MRVTRRQLRQIIRESMMPPAGSKPSKKASVPLESLFRGNARYGLTNDKAWFNLKKDIDTIAKEIPGLEQKIRKILGPSPEPLPPGWSPRDLYEFLGTHMRAVYKKTRYKDPLPGEEAAEHRRTTKGWGWRMAMTQEWAEFGLDLIRQAGIEEEILNLNRSLEEAEKDRLAKEKAEKEAAELLRPQVPVDTNTGTDLSVDAMGADDAVDSVSGDATDPAFLRQLAGWLKKMDKNPAIQTIMFNMD